MVEKTERVASQTPAIVPCFLPPPIASGEVAECLCHKHSRFFGCHQALHGSPLGALLSFAAKVTPQGSGLQPQGAIFSGSFKKCPCATLDRALRAKRGVALDSVPIGLSLFPFGIASPSRGREGNTGAELLCCLGGIVKAEGQSLWRLLKRKGKLRHAPQNPVAGEIKGGREGPPSPMHF